MARTAYLGQQTRKQDAVNSIWQASQAQEHRLAGTILTVQDINHGIWTRMMTEAHVGDADITCDKNSWSNATGYFQMLPSFVHDNASAVGSSVTWDDISNGKTTFAQQASIYANGYVTFAKSMTNYAAGSDLTKDQIMKLTFYAMNIGPGKDKEGNPGVRGVLHGLKPSQANFAEMEKRLVDSCRAQNKGKTTSPAGESGGSNEAPVIPTTATATTYQVPKSVLAAAQNTTPLVPTAVIKDGLDNVPWWKVEGLLVGNPNLRRIPDALSFRVRLYRDKGTVLTDSKGQPIEVRLNCGVDNFSTGSTHQNTIEPTATALLMNVWEAKPDMINAHGTTGVFLNQFGLSDFMSANGSAQALGLYDIMDSAYSESPKALAAKLKMSNKFRVAAQDAFVELLSLFKSNGIQRFLPLDLAYTALDKDGKPVVELVNQNAADAKNEQAWSATAGLTGFQMRHRVGDVFQSGYVEMTYRGRVLLGQFKSFEWLASAESPFRWDFSFVFRVMRELTPYYLGGS